MAPLAISEPALEIMAADRQTTPLVLASPHSGDRLPARPPGRLPPRRPEPPALGRQLVSMRIFGAPRPGSARRCSRHASPAPISDPNREPFELDPGDVRGCAAGFRQPPFAARAGSASARSRASSLRARRSIPASCISPKRYSGSSGSTALYHRAPWRAARRSDAQPLRLLPAAGLPFDALHHPAAAQRAGASGGRSSCSAIVTAHPATRSSPDTARRVLVDKGYSVVRNAPYAGVKASRRRITASPARAAIACRSRSGAGSTWTSAAMSAKPSSRSWRRICATSPSRQWRGSIRRVLRPV